MSVDSKTQSPPWWLWPNLLSLDAPLVALVWVEILAQSFRVQSMQWESRAVLVISVWVIYVVDRLLDAKKAGFSEQAPWLKKRHEFHRKWRGLFIAGVIAGVGLVVWMLLYRIGSLISVLGFHVALMSLLYLFVASVRRPAGSVEYGKNLIAGFTFAAGVAVPVFYHAGIHGFFELITSRSVLFLGVMATLNITAIDLWEHAALTKNDDEKDASELALSLPLVLLAGLSFFLAINSPEMTNRWAMYAIFIAAAGLQILNRYSARFSIDALRVLADLALIIPYVVLMASPP